MTTIGKILVIVNFVFSLVVGFLIIMVFSLSTNWESSYRKLKGYYDVSQANVQVYQQETNEERAKHVADVNRRDADIANLKQKSTDQDAELKTKNEKMADLEKQVVLARVSSEESAKELLRIKDELKQVYADVEKREKIIVDLGKTAKAQQDAAVQSDIRAKAYQERAKSLQEAYEQASRENERLKQGPSTTGRGQIERRPPPEDVEGIVEATNPQSGLVTISVGSDAGLSKGNSLFVYRLSPKPQYLGEIRILDVNPHKAVGRPVMAQRGNQLQAGDIVASQIGGQR